MSRGKDKISKLEDKDGFLHTGEREMYKIITDYFKDIKN